MEYTELKCMIEPGHADLAEQLMALLSEHGYESFSEESNELLAYIPSHNFDATILDSQELLRISEGIISFSWKAIPEQDWNAVWESNFQPVVIGGECYIRAPFHEKLDQYPYQLIIEPKMSFGSAHHETTALMIEYLLDTEAKGKSVLDMGCGTGVLAILAALRGSHAITAIDNDEWAYRNTLENIERNNTPFINVYLGDASLLSGKKFDIIIANINRNILLNDIPVYVKSLNDNGLLLMSGFYLEDLNAIKERTSLFGLKYKSHKEKNRWVAACFQNV